MVVGPSRTPPNYLPSLSLYSFFEMRFTLEEASVTSDPVLASLKRTDPSRFMCLTFFVSGADAWHPLHL